MRNTIIAGIASSVLLAAPAFASTFNVDEFDFGDFDGAVNAGNDNVGTATAGFSFVSGGLAGECVPGDCNNDIGGDTQDSFFFTIADGFQLDEISVATEGGGPEDLTISFSLREAMQPYTSLGFGTFEINESGLVDFDDPLAAGTYSFSAFGQSASEAGDFDAFWAVAFVVSAATTAPVPLPASAPLLLAGLGGVWALRRRKKAV
ncbi:VPLPA-CTERM sorting domain-containing protein [Primorskyibacter sp. S187A]|uniref:VPLPA-CTERM sorting domain-containing protein n=1 Tax=Primorskyibacter sp. S187A TaxID=3415130 RepID=UPI003C7CFDDB